MVQDGSESLSASHIQTVLMHYAEDSVGLNSGSYIGMHAGTFLYVAFMEVIPREMHNPEQGLSKLGVLLLGFGAMSLLAIWA